MKSLVSPTTILRRWISILFLGTTIEILQAANSTVEGWLTTQDLHSKLTPISTTRESISSTKDTKNGVEIRLDPTRTYQSIFGFGSSLEPTTCSNLWRMSSKDRDTLLTAMFDPRKGIGMNLMRVCIGTPDFTGDAWYSYCDLPPGKTDPELKTFSIQKDRAYILPMIQAAHHKRKDLVFFASPWSPPGWMKNNGSMIGGSLLRRWYGAYAQYFVRFIQSYAAEGIPIYAVTVQNEPGVDRATNPDPKWHYPSCKWTAEEELYFIRDYLSPAFRKAGLKTRIWCYDHNYNLKPEEESAGIGYPLTILRDPQASSRVDGVAFHGYSGQASAMSLVHDAFPSKPIHFSEGSIFGIDGAKDLIERLQNWAVSYNGWVFMLDDQGKPNNGPFPASHAVVALNHKTLKTEYLLEYYVYGHFMKFLPKGSVRIESDEPPGAPPSVCFRTPDQEFVFIAANPSGKTVPFQIRTLDTRVLCELPSKSVGTWRWK